ncbi:MAG: hypothetical protein U1G07_24485 [Verrucomicrobiota bacterium]
MLDELHAADLVTLASLGKPSDHRFDPNVAAQLLSDIAHEQSLEQLLRKLVHRAVERPDIACAQIWLIDKGDLCSVCPSQARCVDRTRCLHLVAGKGVSLQGGSTACRDLTI